MALKSKQLNNINTFLKEKFDLNKSNSALSKTDRHFYTSIKENSIDSFPVFLDIKHQPIIQGTSINKKDDNYIVYSESISFLYSCKKLENIMFTLKTVLDLYAETTNYVREYNKNFSIVNEDLKIFLYSGEISNMNNNFNAHISCWLSIKINGGLKKLFHVKIQGESLYIDHDTVSFEDFDNRLNIEIINIIAKTLPHLTLDKKNYFTKADIRSDFESVVKMNDLINY